MLQVRMEIVDLSRDTSDVIMRAVHGIEEAHQMRLDACLQYDAHYSDIDIDDDEIVQITIVGNDIL